MSAEKNYASSSTDTGLTKTELLERIVESGLKKTDYLLSICKSGDTPAVEAYLKFYPADINCSDKDGRTPLYIASQNGHAGVVEQLLAAGANPDIARNTGGTPLFIASQEGHASVVEKLLAAGVNPDIARNTGGTPLYIASQNGHSSVVEKLLAAGANPDIAENNGATPLYIASQNGHASVVEQLLAKGANPDKAINNGNTPLYIASRNGHTGVVEKLLAARANPDKAINNGVTPLYIASGHGHAGVVEKLLAAGANPDKAMNDGATPLLIANLQNHQVICAILKSYMLSHQILKFNTEETTKLLDEGVAPNVDFLLASTDFNKNIVEVRQFLNTFCRDKETDPHKYEAIIAPVLAQMPRPSLKELCAKSLRDGLAARIINGPAEKQCGDFDFPIFIDEFDSSISDAITEQVLRPSETRLSFVEKILQQQEVQQQEAKKTCVLM